MISNFIAFCLTHLDVFDGVIIGILFTLGCKRLEKHFSKKTEPQTTVVSLGSPSAFELGGASCMARVLEANKEAVVRSMGIPEHELHQP